MNIKSYLTGLQHIGIPVHDLNQTIPFYEGIGFEMMHYKHVVHNDVKVKAAFMKLHELVLEFYELEGSLLEEITDRKDGHIDHFAINTNDVEALYKLIQAGPYRLLDTTLQGLDFFEKGVMFFRILGPSNEVIEFNQILD